MLFRSPIPTYNGAGLVNPGVNPGFIQPDQFYGTQAPGVDQYYWGQHGYAQTMADLANYNTNAVNAPATPYGNPNAVNLGQLITPEAISYPSQFTQAAAQGTATPTYQPGAFIPSDVYRNQVQMTTPTPAVPGFSQIYGPQTQAMMATGQGQGVQYALGQNYVPYPTVALATTGTDQTTIGAPGANTPAAQIGAITPQQLAAQTLAAANAVAPQ